MKKLHVVFAAAICLVASARALDLSTVTSNTTIPNGTTVTGTLGSNVKLSIAQNATVTLSGATINGVNDSNYKWAGLTCQGDATIVLEGVNSVRGFYLFWPGIHVPAGKTLVIRGSGSLTASSTGQAPGIGANRGGSGGNVVIEGGTIVATGGEYAAGIGGSYLGSCGNITIEGGSVTATGGVLAAGIGGGNRSSCSNIVIRGGTVVATGGRDSAGVGSGYDGSSCGTVDIVQGVKAVTAVGGSGASQGIGAGTSSTCGTVTVDGTIMVDTSSGATRAIVGDLSALDFDATVRNGGIVTGTLGANVKVAVAAGATVTLRDATINGVKDGELYQWAGITCLGSATIVLEGANSVRGFHRYYPGISVTAGSTLTIRGTGSLAASSNGYGAGIGGGFGLQCGSIVIESGTIAATGGERAAGIGGGQAAACGDITISGGDVSSTGGDRAVGIGGGYGATCGNIVIGSGIDRVVATAGSSTIIGAGPGGTGGGVTVGSGLCDTTIGSTRTIAPWAELDLSEVTEDTVAQHGAVLSGTLGGNFSISIADGATVALSGATINGVHSSSCKWAGLTCLGDAIIVIYGENAVRGFHEDYPGIFVPDGSTLTVRGSGSLVASGNGWSAGIGGGYNLTRGNIVIEGGVIVATGGKCAAGIGGGWGPGTGSIDDTDGYVEIRGGTVTATGGESAAGIGGGAYRPCNYIGISGGAVTATGGTNAAGIGTGFGGQCPSVAIVPDAVRVTATCGAGCENPIGAGVSGTCDGIGVVSMFDTTSGSTRVLSAKSINLAGLTSNADVADGATVTGTLAGYYRVAIDDGATVTVRDVTILGASSTLYEWGGITCLGDATIVLEGDSTVLGFHSWYPGIHVPAGKTLTIRGTGSIDAYSNGQGAGIGGGKTIPCGNIVVEGGVIAATGGDFAAGIGGGSQASCGGIVVRGGTVTAHGGYAAAGIGGSSGSCSAVAVGSDIVRVVATAGAECPNPLGAGRDGSCGAVVVDSGLADETSGRTRTLSPLGGSGATPAPTFAADGRAVTTEFAKGANGTWTLTVFAELSNDAVGANVADGQISVYAADTPEGLQSASPMADGVTVTEKRSAVMTTIEVTPPGNPDRQFFQVRFGD